MSEAIMRECPCCGGKIEPLKYQNEGNRIYIDGEKIVTKCRWIPCSERLPEEETDVIAVIDGCSREAFYSDSSFIGSDFYRNAEEVFYWMPKPEPPKEADND